MEAQLVSRRLGPLTVGLLLCAACMRRPGDDTAKLSPSAPAATSAALPPQRPADAQSAPPTAPSSLAPTPAAPSAPPATPADPYGADLDPDNDLVVAPPSAIPECHEELTRAGVTFRPGALPLEKNAAGTFTCGAHDAVVVQKWPSGTSLSPPALLTCRMALALVRLEPVMQELAEKELGTTVRKIHHMGTYSCRKMVRFDFVSEHSYGNAIDIGSFTLADGRKVSVATHFGPLDAEPADARSRFLRQLGNAAFDRNLVSVSLGPYWDALHRDHFHFDMAHYRVDGSRR